MPGNRDFPPYVDVGLNRTFMELKYVIFIFNKAHMLSLNRTFMELKYIF